MRNYQLVIHLHNFHLHRQLISWSSPAITIQTSSCSSFAAFWVKHIPYVSYLFERLRVLCEWKNSPIDIQREMKCQRENKESNAGSWCLFAPRESSRDDFCYKTSRLSICDFFFISVRLSVVKTFKSLKIVNDDYVTRQEGRSKECDAENHQQTSSCSLTFFEKWFFLECGCRRCLTFRNRLKLLSVSLHNAF